MEAEFIEVTDHGRTAIVPERVSPDLYLASMSNTPSLILSSITGAQGPCLTLSTGCIGGADAIGYGFEAIRHGEADVMLAGASEGAHHADHHRVLRDHLLPLAKEAAGGARQDAGEAREHVERQEHGDGAHHTRPSSMICRDD